MRARASSLRPTLSVRSATSKFACDSARRAARSRLLAQQGTELPVEVGRRFQQPVAQVLELLLLEQEVLADAGVERLDGVDAPGRTAPARSWRSARLASARLLLVSVERRAIGVGRVCTASTADSPTTPASTAAAAPVTPVRCRVSQRNRVRVQGSA